MLVSFRAVLDRFSRFELAVPSSEIHYHPSFALRGPTKLPLRLTPKAG